MEHHPAVLAVGDSLKAELFLHLHRVTNVIVLDGTKLLACHLGKGYFAAATDPRADVEASAARIAGVAKELAARTRSGAVLLLWGENTPCTIAGAMVSERYGTRAEAFPKAAMGLRGVTGWVEHPGPVRPGDGIEVRLPHA